MSAIIFETIHGSRLYGLSHQNSDHDLYRITTSRRTSGRHQVTLDQDLVTMGIAAFLQRALSGSHQAVEALYSPFKVWHDESYRSLLENTYLGGHEVFEKHERTIKAFSFGDRKRRRHAARLAINLAQLRTYGNIMPVLNPEQIEFVNELADTYIDEELHHVLQSTQMPM